MYTIEIEAKYVNHLLAISNFYCFNSVGSKRYNTAVCLMNNLTNFYYTLRRCFENKTS